MRKNVGPENLGMPSKIKNQSWNMIAMFSKSNLNNPIMIQKLKGERKINSIELSKKYIINMNRQ